ncbi:MAG: hypothetical protein ABI197_00765 [Granulicella sp.]
MKIEEIYGLGILKEVMPLGEAEIIKVDQRSSNDWINRSEKRRQQRNADAAGLRMSAKHLHLAFKNCTTSDEVYDTLVSVFLDVAAHYDPHYTKKTEEVCNFIEKQSADAVIKIDEFGSAVDFDPLGCIRVLVRHHYLQSVSGARKKVLGYQRGEN